MSVQSMMLLVVLLVTMFKLISSDEQQGQTHLNTFPLEGKSFKLETSVRTEKTGLVVYFDEYYSRLQQRARIHFKSKHQDSYSDFYFDLKSEQSLSWNPELRECKPITFKELNVNLFSSQTCFDLLAYNDQEQLDIDQHVIGPARILFLILRLADFSQNSTDIELGSRIEVRNLPAIEYKLYLRLPNGYLDASVFYNLIDHRRESAKFTIPLRVTLKSRRFNYDSSIDFFKYEILDDDGRISKFIDIQNEDKATDKMLDLFMIPISVDCSQYLNRTEIDLFREYNLEELKFSTTINSEQPFIDKLIKHFLAFDGKNQMLRVDIEDNSPNVFNNRRFMNSRNVLDLEINRRYLITEKQLYFQANGRNYLVLNDRPDKRAHCDITYINPPDEAREVLDISTFLFGAQNFTYMGLAEVRGKITRVYETRSKTLPLWLNLPMVYKDNNSFKYDKIRFGGSGIREDSREKSSQNFNILIYIAQESGTVKPLLVEVYNMKIDKTSSYRRTLIGYFYNFIWNLNSSPTGESVQELFKMHETCSVDLYNEFTELEFLLEKQDKPYDDEIKEEQWLEDSKERNQALANAMRSHFKVKGSMINSLNSRIYTTNQAKQFLSVYMKIAKHPQTIQTVTFIGNAVLSNNLHDLSVSYSQSVIDCLWLINKQQVDRSSSIYVYFMEARDSFCLIVPDINNDSLNQSKIVTLNSGGLGELYRIDKNFDSEIAINNNWLYEKGAEQIKDRLINLKNTAPDSEGALFQIRKFNVKIPNNMEENRIPVIYSGYRYARESNYSWQVEPADEDFTTISMHQCQAACLSDVECRSYSYCIHTLKAKCILSNIGLENEHIRLGFSSLDGGTKIREKIATIQTEKDLVKLVKDDRCEIHGKIYINLFIPDGSLKTTLKGHQVYSVDNEEQCAEICFGRSLDSIRASVSMNRQIRNFMEDLDDDKLLKQAVDEIHQEHHSIVAKFCRNFLYINSMVLRCNETLVIDRRALINPAKASKSSSKGYCLLEGESNSADIDKELFQFFSYKFDFTTLYERHYGFMLQESPLDKSEYDAFVALKSGNSHNSAHYELLQQSIKSGKNFQQTFYRKPIDCAYMCFNENTALWPDCQSFDVVLEQEDETRQSNVSLCYLNTITLKQFNKPEEMVLLVKKKKNEQIWHFEPRFGFIDWKIVSSNPIETRLKFSNIHQSSLTICVISFCAIVGGLFMGILIGRSVGLRQQMKSKKPEEDRNQNSDMLVLKPVKQKAANSIENQQEQSIRTGRPHISSPIPIVLRAHPYANDSFLVENNLYLN